MNSRIEIDLPINTRLEEIKILVIAQVVEKFEGNVAKAAVALDISMPVVYRAVAKVKAKARDEAAT